MVPVDLTHALVIQGDCRRPWLAARTHRSLKAAGIDEVFDGNDLAGRGWLDFPVLIIRAGHVFHDPASVRVPPGNGDRVAVGLAARWNSDSEWSRYHAMYGGDYPRFEELPAPVCEWHSSGQSALARIGGFARPFAGRVFHWSPLDHAPLDERLFVMEVVTSLQQGGAERIARDLAWNLPEYGVRSQLISLGKPHRTPLDFPEDTLDLSALQRDERIERLREIAFASGVDVIHTHLTNLEETRCLAASGIPVLSTVHNARPGWPRGWDSLAEGDVGLLLACAQAVEADVRESLPAIPVRTVWNGINPHEFPDVVRSRKDRRFTLVCVANPRLQKRLELLPSILTATRTELRSRGIHDAAVRLVIVGETSQVLAEALTTRETVDAEVKRLRVEDSVEWTDGRGTVREWLESADVMVSCSAYEGLSLAQLEGISSGLPLVVADTGGTRELAWGNQAVTLLAADANPSEFAHAIVDALLDPPCSGHAVIWRDFTTERMTRRVAFFANLLACRSLEPGSTLWFVTNNLSTGGAQSSLRRLLKSFHQRGQKVRLVLIQEYPEHPTAGRLDLIEAGIEVFVPPPAGRIDPDEAVDLILAEMSLDPPTAVVFWNAIFSHKILLADALPFTRVFDVSPGEMWFSAMERFFDRPLSGFPYRAASGYAKLLEGIIVKYSAEVPRAAGLGAAVHVVSNGVMIPETLDQRGSGGAIVFGSAGRISPQKCLDELIEAFRLASGKLPGAILRIAGGVETGAEVCAGELRDLSRGLAVEWCGELLDLGEFHSSCDVFVMISEPAGCPNASLEALAAGLPVVATDVGGVSEQVIDGVNGRLVPPRDIPAFADAMVDLANDPKRRVAMSAAAREHVRRHFSLERMTAEYAGILGVAVR